MHPEGQGGEPKRAALARRCLSGCSAAVALLGLLARGVYGPASHDDAMFYCVPAAPFFSVTTLVVAAATLNRRVGPSLNLGWWLVLCLFQWVVVFNPEYDTGRQDPVAMVLATIAPVCLVGSFVGWRLWRPKP